MRPLIFLALLFTALPAAAIVNLEDLHLSTPPEGWSGGTRLGLSGNAGNTRTLDVNAALRLGWRRGELTRYALLDERYGESRGARSIDRSFLHLRQIRQFRPRLAREGFLQLERDAFARLALRALAGGGARLTLASREARTALLGLGGFYSRERLVDRDTGEALEYGQWRANVYLILKRRLDAHRRLWLTTYAQPDLSRPDDLRLLASAGAAMDLGERWEARWSLNYAFDSRPPQGVRRYDLGLGATLAFSF